MRKKILFTILAVSIVLCCVRDARPQDKWQAADAATIRLAPTVFPQLSRKIIRHLQARKCLVPQIFSAKRPHNVIRGEFAKRGQRDWAVLCSRNKVSSILVFWGGSANFVAELAKAEDRGFLQGIDGAGRIGYSRAISVVGRGYILEHHKEYGGPRPPRLRHEGINDTFVEKASTVRYYYRGKWLKLQGAD